MKLNISSKELLALHDLLLTRYGELAPEDKERPADVQLRQVYNRLRACIIAALTNKASDPFDAWRAREQAKIDALTSQNEVLKKDAEGLMEALQLDPQDDDFTAAQYPRQGSNGRQGKRSNKR